MSLSDNIHKNHRHRLRERYAKEGAGSLEAHELLELLLFDVIPRYNTNPIAHRLLNRFGSLYDVLNAPFEELLEVKGIGERAAEYIVNAAREFRGETERAFLEKPMTTLERVSNYLIWRMSDGAEAIVAIATDERMGVLGVKGFDSSVSPAEIAEYCATVRAKCVIIGVRVGVDLTTLPTQADLGDVTLCDVIKINGFSTESVGK